MLSPVLEVLAPTLESRNVKSYVPTEKNVVITLVNNDKVVVTLTNPRGNRDCKRERKRDQTGSQPVRKHEPFRSSGTEDYHRSLRNRTQKPDHPCTGRRRLSPETDHSKSLKRKQASTV